MIYAVTRAVNRVALGTGVDGEAAVTAGHHPECINDANWACATRRLGVWRQGATGAGRDQNEDFPISGDACPNTGSTVLILTVLVERKIH